MIALNHILDEFDRLWRGGRPPVLAEFLEQSSLSVAVDRLEALTELIAIDMEYRWRTRAPELTASSSPGAQVDTVENAASEATAVDRHGGGPLIEDYARQWPEIVAGDGIPLELIAEEYRIRQRWGDRPALDVYLDRFGNGAELRHALEAVRRELALDGQAGEPDETPTCNEPFSTEPVTFGRYRVLQRLGHGGMGDVYLAEDTRLERRVALKIPHLVDREDLRHRFVNEAKAAAVLQHPGICPVYDTGEIEGKQFISMAFIDGPTLREHWEQAGPLDIDGCLGVFAQIADAMQAAHDSGIVHRDLKPTNVMLDANGKPVVMDFGLACRERLPPDERITQTGDMFGSPGYMSPEQIEGRTGEIGPASDIYSLGTMLFEALTGRLPFTGPVGRLMTAIVRDPPPRLAEFREEIDPELEQLCFQMLAKSPADRPPSMNAVAHRLMVLSERLSGQSTKSPTATAASEPSPRRGRWKWIAAACLPLLILLGVVLQIKTPYGTVRIEVSEEFAGQVQVRALRSGELVEVADRESGWTLTLKEGEYDFELGKGDERFEMTPHRVQVTRDSTQIVVVTFIDPPVTGSEGESQPTLDPGRPTENFALFFDGIDDHVVTPILYDGSHPITIEAWVAAADPWEQGTIIGNRDGYRGITLAQVSDSNSPNWNAGVQETGPSQPLANLFQRPRQNPKTHLAFVWDGEECRWYVDGNADRGYSKQVLQEIPASEHPFRLGVLWYRNRLSTEPIHRFHGLMDEIRISSVARYTANFAPAQRFEPDEQTLALYHCDEGSATLLRDSSGRGHHATITGATWKPAYEMHVPSPYYGDLEDFERHVARDMPERTGPALRFETTTAHVAVPTVDLDFTKPFTLELWLTPQQEFLPTHPWWRMGCQFGNFGLRFDLGDNNWRLTAWDGREFTSMPWRSRTVRLDHRTHLAGQWNGKELKLYLNGQPCPGPVITHGSIAKLREAILENLAASNGQPITLGSLGENAQLGGTIDRFRLSNVARYDGPFAPEEFTADESTAVMYDFQEGEGSILQDLSGNGYDGKISPAAIWEPAPPKTPPLPGLVTSPREMEGIARWQVVTRWSRAQPVLHNYSPDGRWYASGSDDGYVRIFSGGPKGNLHSVVHVRHQQRNQAFLMDWSPDSLRFVTCSDDWVQVWSVEGRLLHEWQGKLTGLEWSPDGSLIAGIDRSGVAFWKPDGALEFTFRTYGASTVSRFSWDAAGQRYITSNGMIVLVGNLQGEVVRQFPVTASARELEWSPNGERIAIVTSENRLQMWTPDGERLRESSVPHGDRYSPPRWSPDSKSLALADLEHVMVWDADGEPRATFPSVQFKADGNNLCWSPDSRHVLIAKVDRSVAVHRTDDGKQVDSIQCDSPRITAVDWNDRRKLLTASAHADRPLRLFDDRGIPTGSFLDVAGMGSYDIRWQPSGGAVYVGGGTELYRFGVSEEKQLVGPGTVLARESSQHRVIAVHPMRNLIAASGHPSHRVQIVDSTGNAIAARENLGRPVSELAFSPDGKWLAICVTGRSLSLVDTNSWDIETWLGSSCYSVGWSSDSSMLATNGDRGTIAVYDVRGQKIETIEPVWNTGRKANALNSITWSPDDRWVICSRNDETHAYNRQTGQRKNFTGQADVIRDATWINDRDFVICSHDGTLTCWNVETGEARWRTIYLRRNAQHLDAVTFSPDGVIRHADPGAADRLMFVVEREPGRLDVLSREEFTREFPEASPFAGREYRAFPRTAHKRRWYRRNSRPIPPALSVTRPHFGFPLDNHIESSNENLARGGNFPWL